LDGGAELRISGGTPQTGISGSADWRLFSYEFQASKEGDEVEFICELRAGSGEAWFDAASLKISRIP
jgi:hypothetical protein